MAILHEEGRLAGSPRVADRDLPRVEQLARALDRRRVGGYERWVKPVVDRTTAALLLLVVSPVMVVVALAILLALGRPLLLRQPRIGHGGRVFLTYKFRTMHPDRRRTDARDFDGPDLRRTHKSADDPRLVPVGRFLRKWSLDELPQLLNVLRGEMSLVGPRPEMVAIVERYAGWQHKRHIVKPGVTGLWQVSARGDGPMHERTDVDLEYVKRLSLREDLRILLLTIPAALGLRKGI